MDANAITIGNFAITWYAIIIVTAIIIAIFLGRRELKYHNMHEEVYFDFVFWLIIFGFLGARTWYVVFQWEYYSDNLGQIIAIWNGGLAIHGAIVGVLLYTLYFSRQYGYNFLMITDVIAPIALLGQSLGRWGNFFNQEAHGGETTQAFLSDTLHLPNFIVEGMNIQGTYYHPTFLYESVWNFIGFLLAYFILRVKFRYNYGIVTSFYLIWYGTIRFFIEQMRTDALTWGPIRVAQLASLIMVICGIILLVFSIRKMQLQKKEHNKHENRN